MKKISIIVAVIAFSATSCKKDYTCTCSDTILGTTISTSGTAKTSKKDADAWCAAFQTDYNSQAGGSGFTCAIK